MLLISGLGKQKIILGLPWLRKENPDINWKTGEIKWRTPDQLIKRMINQRITMIEEVPDDQEWMNHTSNPLNDDEQTIEESNAFAISYVDDITIVFLNGDY